jgi:hypothetical protein
VVETANILEDKKLSYAERDTAELDYPEWLEVRTNWGLSDAGTIKKKTKTLREDHPEITSRNRLIKKALELQHNQLTKYLTKAKTSNVPTSA